MKNTQVNYMYRDANNYKEFGEVILEGSLTKDQIKEMMRNRHDGMYFIPSQVGLDDLQESLQGLDSQDWGDDHCWHEIEPEGITQTDKEPTITMTAEEFYNQFVNAIWEEFEVGHVVNGTFKGGHSATPR